jgi:hypothetical protein
MNIEDEKWPTLNSRTKLSLFTAGGDRNDVVGYKNQDPKKREIILFLNKK